MPSEHGPQKPKLSELNKVDQKEKPVDMEAFLVEIKDLIEKRQQNYYFGGLELLHIRPQELTEADARMWYKVKNHKENPISQKEFDAYADQVMAEANSSRIEFRAFISNQLPILEQ